jgi:poly-beta-1,6-N-acetyl-D-glucosamine synthase
MAGLLASSLALVFYTAIGYPLIMAAWARLRPRPVATSASYAPSVTLVIAAYNEADCIEAKLENCSALDYPADRLEIVVATDGSDDGTPHLVERARDPRVRLLHRPEREGKMAALNRAVEQARGEMLVFSDANNFYRPDTLRRLVEPFFDPTVGVVTGRKAIAGSERELDQAEGLYWRYEAKITSWESLTGSVTGVAGEVLAIRREAFVSQRDEVINDDTMLALAAAIRGWRIAYAPAAVSFEPASATVEDEMMRRSRIFAGTYQTFWRLLPALLRSQPRLAWQLVSHKGLRPVVPFALTAALVSNLALARRSSWLGSLAAMQAAFYGTALWGWRQDRAGRRGGRWPYLAYYFCQANGAALRGLVRFASGGDQKPWTKARRGNMGADSRGASSERSQHHSDT